MIDNKLRHGNFTSSKIYRLCGSIKNGEPSASFYSYVEEKMFERKLKRSLENGAYSQSMAWGKFLEKRVNDNLGLEYELISKTTFLNPKISCHSGSPDFIVKGIKVAELKCYQMLKFARYATALSTRDTEYIKTEFPDEYWQIISNAMIQGVFKGEAILYAPYESEMEEIRELAQDPEYLNKIGMMPWEVRFITENSNSQLSVLPNDSSFQNLNIFEFDLPIDDVIFLTKRLKMAERLLTNV